MSVQHLANITRPSVREAGCKIARLLNTTPCTVAYLYPKAQASKTVVKYALLWLRDVVGAPLEYTQAKRWRLTDANWSLPWKHMTPTEQIRKLTELVDPGYATDLHECIQTMMDDQERLYRENVELRRKQKNACPNPQQPHLSPNLIQPTLSPPPNPTPH